MTNYRYQYVVFLSANSFWSCVKTMKFTFQLYRMILHETYIDINFVLGDGWGHIFLFKKNYEKMFQFSSFLTTSKKYVGHSLVLYTHMCSRCYMCTGIFKRFKQLLNFKAYIERNCNFFCILYQCKKLNHSFSKL